MRLWLKANYNNLDLYLYKWNGNAYALFAYRTGSTSNEYIDFSVPKGTSYWVFRAKRAGGTVGTYTANFYLYNYQYTSTPTTVTTTEIGNEIFKQVNAKRTQSGRSALSRDTFLDSLAQTHANYMASKQQISHDNSDYRWQQMRNNGYTAYGENVASAVTGNVYMDCSGPLVTVPNTNAGIAKLMVDNWYTYDSCHSWGHKNNILNANFNRTGIGVAKGSNGRYYACQIFGKK